MADGRVGRLAALRKLVNANDFDPLPRAGEGVLLRRLGVGDLAVFQAYRGDAELGRYQGWSPMSAAKAAAFLDEMSAAPLFRPGEWAQIGIAEPSGSRLLGDIGLFLAEDGREAEIGFTLARAAQGRGLATAAVREALRLVFESVPVLRVVGITDARNLASIRLLERVGMARRDTREAVFREETCIEHVYVAQRDAG